MFYSLSASSTAPTWASAQNCSVLLTLQFIGCCCNHSTLTNRGNTNCSHYCWEQHQLSWKLKAFANISEHLHLLLLFLFLPKPTGCSFTLWAFTSIYQYLALTGKRCFNCHTPLLLHFFLAVLPEHIIRVGAVNQSSTVHHVAKLTSSLGDTGHTWCVISSCKHMTPSFIFTALDYFYRCRREISLPPRILKFWVEFITVKSE